MVQSISFARRDPVPQPPQGWFALAYSITLRGDLAIMWANCDVRALHLASRDSNGVWHAFDAPDGAKARISVFDGTGLTHCAEFPLVHFPYVFFDQLPDCRWVIARKRGLRGDPLVQIVGPGGTVKRIRLGVDILHLQCSPDGYIWVGYGDIGCLYSRGLAAHGINKFLPSGRRLWGFNADSTIKRNYVDTAECLNVSDIGIFGLIWPGYVITQIDIAKPRFWRSRSEVPQALATDGKHVMLAGGFAYKLPGDYFRLSLQGPPSRPSSRRLRRIWRGTLDRPEREQERLIVGRGNCLHCVTDDCWSRLSIDEALAQVSQGGKVAWDNANNNTAFDTEVWSQAIADKKNSKT